MLATHVKEEEKKYAEFTKKGVIMIYEYTNTSLPGKHVQMNSIATSLESIQPLWNFCTKHYYYIQ